MENAPNDHPELEQINSAPITELREKLSEMANEYGFTQANSIAYMIILFEAGQKTVLELLDINLDFVVKALRNTLQDGIFKYPFKFIHPALLPEEYNKTFLITSDGEEEDDDNQSPYREENDAPLPVINLTEKQVKKYLDYYDPQKFYITLSYTMAGLEAKSENVKTLEDLACYLILHPNGSFLQNTLNQFDIDIQDEIGSLRERTEKQIEEALAPQEETLESMLEFISSKKDPAQAAAPSSKVDSPVADKNENAQNKTDPAAGASATKKKVPKKPAAKTIDPNDLLTKPITPAKKITRRSPKDQQPPSASQSM